MDCKAFSILLTISSTSWSVKVRGGRMITLFFCHFAGFQDVTLRQIKVKNYHSLLIIQHIFKLHKSSNGMWRAICNQIRWPGKCFSSNKEHFCSRRLLSDDQLGNGSAVHGCHRYSMADASHGEYNVFMVTQIPNNRCHIDRNWDRSAPVMSKTDSL